MSRHPLHCLLLVWITFFSADSSHPSRLCDAAPPAAAGSAEQEEWEWSLVFSFFNALADNDFSSAQSLAEKLLMSKSGQLTETANRALTPRDAAREVLVLCMMSQEKQREIPSAFRALRSTGLTGVKSDGSLTEIARQLQLGEATLRAFAEQCPNIYCRYSLISAAAARMVGRFGIAAEIAARARRHAQASWGVNDIRFAATVAYDNFVRHTDRLPGDLDSSELRGAVAQLLDIRGLSPSALLAATELLAMCEIRDGRFDSARKVIDGALEQTAGAADEFVVARTNLKMLLVHSQIASGRLKEGMSLYESLEHDFVRGDFSQREAFERAFDAVHRAYLAERPPEKCTNVLWTKRKCSAQINLNRMHNSVVDGWVTEGVVTEDAVDANVAVAKVRSRAIQSLIKKDLSTASSHLSELLAAESRAPDLTDWIFATDWLSADIEQRLANNRHVPADEQRAISLTWRVLTVDTEVFAALLADRDRFRAAIEADGNGDGAGAYYFHAALSAAFRGTGQFDEAHRELQIAAGILRKANREKSALALMLSKDEMFMAVLRRDKNFDPATILLPHEVEDPVSVFHMPRAAPCYIALACLCNLREEYEQAWHFSYHASAVADHDALGDWGSRDWVYVGTVASMVSSHRTGRETPTNVVRQFEVLRRRFVEAGDPALPEGAWYFYETGAAQAEELGYPKIATQYRNVARQMLVPVKQ